MFTTVVPHWDGMCGRISLFADVETIADRFGVEITAPIKPRYNVAPRDWLGSITSEHPDALARLEWGLVPHWASSPEDGPRPINARREGVDEAAPFREPYASRRCLVVIDGYYEWAETPAGKQPYRFERRDREPFALAGVWDRWEADDQTLDTVAILTASAVDEVAEVHDRMPVILNRSREHDWLDSPPADPRSVDLDPAWDETFHHYPISTRVNNPEHDDPSVIEPAEGSGQPTLADF